MTTAELRLTGLDEVVKKLEKTPELLVGKNGGIARAALRKAAKLLVTKATANLQRSIDNPGRTGVTVSTGETAKAVKVKTTKRRLAQSLLGGKGEAIYVTVNYKAHSTSKGKFRKRTIHLNDIAFLLEVGSANIDPIPWMRPAFTATAESMVQTIQSEIVSSVNRLWG